MNNETTSQPPPEERRGFVRHPRALDILWQMLGRSAADQTPCHILDLSAGGVGLVMSNACDVGTTLLLRLPTRTQGWSSHLVRVKRCVEVAAGRFQVGCAFVRPLSAAELQAHVR